MDLPTYRGERHAAPPEENSFLRQSIADAYRACTKDQNTYNIDNVANNTAEFFKTAALFMPKAAGAVGSAALFALDEAKPKEKADAATDMTLGALKGLGLRAIGCIAGREGVHPVLGGAAMGMGSRVIDTALSRSNYQRADGKGYDAWSGLQNISDQLSNRQALVSDLGLFSITSFASSRLPKAMMQGNARLASGLSGAIYGAFDGANNAINSRAMGVKDQDWQEIFRAGALASARDGLGAALGSSFGSCRAETWRIKSESNPSGPHGEIFKQKNIADICHRREYDDAQFALCRSLIKELNPRQFNAATQALTDIESRVDRRELSQEQVRDAYKDIERLFAPHNGALPEINRPRLATQLLQQIGNPRLVVQGEHGTCYVAAMEHRMYEKHPEKAVRLVTEIARKAAFTPPHAGDAQRITVRREDLTTTAEHAQACTDGGKRSYPSEIFQMTVPNIYWRNRTSYRIDDATHQAKSGTIRFERVKTPDGWDHHLIERNGEETAHIADFPNLARQSIRQLYADITGSDQMFEYSSRSILSKRMLSDVLQDAKRRNAMPVVLIVDSSKPPFGDEPGVHAVTVRDIDPGRNLAHIHNPWGAEHQPGGVAIDVLYKSLYRE